MAPFESRSVPSIETATPAATLAREGGNNNGTSRNWWDILRALAPIAGGAIVGGVLGGKRGSLVGSVGMAKALESYTEQKRIAELAKQEADIKQREAERKQREADIAQQKADTEEQKAIEAERKNKEQESAERDKEKREAEEKKTERATKARLEHGVIVGPGGEYQGALPESEQSPKLKAELTEREARAELYKTLAILRRTPKPEKPRTSSEYREAIKMAVDQRDALAMDEDTPENQAEIAELNEDIKNLRTGLRNLLGVGKKPEREPPEPIVPEKPKPTAATLGDTTARMSAPPPTATSLSRYQGGRPVAGLGPAPPPTATPVAAPTPTPTPTLRGVQGLAPPVAAPTPIPTPVPGPTAQAQPKTITRAQFATLVRNRLSVEPALTQDAVESALQEFLRERGIQVVE